MRIAVTSQNFRTVTGHAGRARRFLIYDVQPNGEPTEVERLDLPKEMAMHDFRGAGRHPVDGVDVILSHSFGEGFAQRMAKRGVRAVASEHTDPVEAIKAFLAVHEREAQQLSAPTCGCGHGHGHGHAHQHRHGSHSGSAAPRSGGGSLETEAPEEEARHG